MFCVPKITFSTLTTLNSNNELFFHRIFFYHYFSYPSAEFRLYILMKLYLLCDCIENTG